MAYITKMHKKGESPPSTLQEEKNLTTDHTENTDKDDNVL
jgi:hypothetical protein